MQPPDAVKSKHTSPELRVCRVVSDLGYRYRLHVRTLPGTPDLVFPKLRKIINVSGCYWHMHSCGRCRIPAAHRRYWIAKLQRNAARDKQMRQALRRAGWKVLTVWECQTSPSKIKALQAKIAKFLAPE